MEIEKLKSRLDSREKQLKEMAFQLAQHLLELSTKDSEIAELSQKVTILEKKLKRKEDQLNQELQDKEILLSKLDTLEKSVENTPLPPPAKNDDSITNAYIDFYTKLHNSEEKPFKHLPELSREGSETSTPPPERTSSFISNEVDITEELQKLGLHDVVKKY